MYLFFQIYHVYIYIQLCLKDIEILFKLHKIIKSSLLVQVVAVGVVHAQQM